MRLIDADELIKQGWVLTRHGASNCLIGIKSIADVPTAFDIDDVAKEHKNMDVENSKRKGYLFVSLFFAISNMIAFLLGNNVIEYFNLVISCLCFICVGMDLKRIMDEKLHDMENK